MKETHHIVKKIRRCFFFICRRQQQKMLRPDKNKSFMTYMQNVMRGDVKLIKLNCWDPNHEGLN